ncbi:MAG: hypothetical protein APR62_01255 [Smithella sp. SDB]|nr:MAG: hypothetical protein APR62_01255 [Smithella sp. SDB]
MKKKSNERKQCQESDSGVSGTVFKIQKLSLDDGPGIRTTILLKGCPLRCLWCSNPESQHFWPELITHFYLCQHCNNCLNTCEKEAIIVQEIDGQLVRTIDRNKCDRCFKCVYQCPTQALRVVGETKTVEDILSVIEQDQDFHEASGGGITISGGEPLAQPIFTQALLQEAKRRNIHTVLDTSGMTQKCILESVLPFVDLVLFDVKHLDSEAHRNATGNDNKVILENLRFLDGKVNIWIRVPVIPDFNDDKTILAIADMASQMHSVKKFCLLPYHQWGSGKYAALGMDYKLEDMSTPSSERMDKIAHQCRNLVSEKLEISVK